MGYSQCLWLF
jgi:branched-chain amino acid aminotransferase